MTTPLDVQVPAGSFFRRAEGLHFTASACAPARVTVSARRAEGDTVTDATEEDLALLCGLSRWRTAAELGVEENRLVHWVSRDALFHASWRPPRDLTGAVLPVLDARVRLRPNVWTRLLLHREDRVAPVPFMPRSGWLDHAAVVGAQFSVFEHGRRTHRLECCCCAEHGRAWRTLLPALLSGVAPDVSRPLLELLNRGGLLEPAVPVPPWDGTPRVTWLGHAAVLVETGGKRVLVDPLWHPISVPERPWLDVPPDPRELGRVDAVLITHGDNDHFNPQALAFLAPDIPVFIPRTVERKPYQVDLAGLLRTLGFVDVREVAWWDAVRLGGLTLRAAPFAGEDWGLTLPGNTWIVESPEFTVYLNADSMEMPEVNARIAREHRVDLACLGVTGNAETYLAPPGFGYGGFYAVWIPARKRNQWVQLCAGPAESARAAVALGARRVFGYAAGGATFLPVAFSDRGTHTELAQRLVDAGHPSVPVSLPLAVPVDARSL